MKSWEARTKLVLFPFSFQDVDNSSRNYQLEVEAQEIISNVRMSLFITFTIDCNQWVNRILINYNNNKKNNEAVCRVTDTDKAPKTDWFLTKIKINAKCIDLIMCSLFNQLSKCALQNVFIV